MRAARAHGRLALPRRWRRHRQPRRRARPARRTHPNGDRAGRRHPLPRAARIRAPDRGRSDLTAANLPAGRFDLVHARLVLEHLPERDRVLSALAAAVRPGGWLLIEDFDWSTAMVVDPPSELHERVAGACLTLFSAHAYDPYYGRRLPRRLAAAGLGDVGTHAESVQVRAHRERGVPQWELLADQLAPGLLAQGLVDQADLERFHALWHDGESVCFAPLLVSSWGRKA